MTATLRDGLHLWLEQPRQPDAARVDACACGCQRVWRGGTVRYRVEHGPESVEQSAPPRCGRGE